MGGGMCGTGWGLEVVASIRGAVARAQPAPRASRHRHTQHACFWRAVQVDLAATFAKLANLGAKYDKVQHTGGRVQRQRRPAAVPATGWGHAAMCWVEAPPLRRRAKSVAPSPHETLPSHPSFRPTAGRLGPGPPPPLPTHPHPSFRPTAGCVPLPHQSKASRPLLSAAFERLPRALGHRAARRRPAHPAP
mgnify:CR=1 FL=1